MEQYIAILKRYLAENPPEYMDTDIHSLLEMLWRCYTESNPVDNDETKALYRSLDPIFDVLPFEDSNFLFGTVVSLCRVFERQAFLSGLRVGAQLTVEIAQM